MTDIPNHKLEAATAACSNILRALAKFALGAGLKYQQLDALLRLALTDEGQKLASTTRARESNISLLAALTGLNRKDLSQRIRQPHEALLENSSVSSRIFTTWMQWVRHKPELAWLPIESKPDGFSFEQLCDKQTKKNVHHRVMLDDLCRLGLVRREDTYAVMQTNAYVPQKNWQEMVGFLGAHTADHLQAATANVLSGSPQFLERSIFVDGISAESGQAIQDRVRDSWDSMHNELYGLMDQAQQIQPSSNSGSKLSHRMRVGVYVYIESEQVSPVPYSKTKESR
jgi:Family of unknown function (DUF6502)